MSCWFVGDVDSLEKFWKFVFEGCSVWLEIFKNCFNIDGFFYLNFEKFNGVSLNLFF